ncbi:MAG: hypothetical protein WAM42_20445 [Candidatus Nitrosopolaris sp.]
MNPKTSIALSIVAIAAVVLLFASGPLVGNQQALAYRYYHGHHGYYHGYYHRHHRGHYYRHY